MSTTEIVVLVSGSLVAVALSVWSGWKGLP